MSNMFRSLLLLCAMAGMTAVSPLFAQTVTGITPSSVTAGSGGLVIAVSGSGFSSSSVVRLNLPNGVQTLQTYFVNTNLLLAGVSAIQTANAGSLPVFVANYGAQTNSNAVALKVLSAGTSSSSGSTSSSGTSSGSTSSGTSSGSGSTSQTPPPPTVPTSTSCYGCVPAAPTSPSGSSSGSSSGSTSSGSTSSGSTGSSGSSATSSSGSNMLVTVSSPRANQTENGSVNIQATAAQTSKTDGGIAYWAIFDSGNLLWIDVNANPTLNVDLALSQGTHTLQISAYDDSYTPSTVTVPVTSSTSGNAMKWHACMYTQNGQQYQAMQLNAQQTVTGVLQSQMFWNSNCNPTQWTDQLNDVGSTMTFQPGMGYTFWFIHRANLPGVSAVWTIGNQTSGCVNYSTAPPCN